MSEEGVQHAQKSERFKRKRKKSFLKNARKYAKKGCYGRGSQLDADTYQYFVRIMEAYRQGFDSDEDKAIFVNNVFEQTVDQEINCCCNQVGCRVIEMLIPFANDEVLKRYMKCFGDELRPLCCDRFASHVIESLVAEAAKKSFKPISKDDINASCKEFVLKVSRFLLNNLEDYLWDTYGNHVIRRCLESLAQIPNEKVKNDAKSEEPDIKVELPEEFIEVIKDYCERIMHWPQFGELCQTDVTSGFLQSLLKALKKADKKLLKKLLEKLLSTNFAPEVENSDSDNLPSVFLSKPAMMVLETTLEVSKSKMFTQIFVKCFSGRLVKLATTRSTNFTVQKLIMNCKEKSEFELMFDELSSNFKEIIVAGHTGIIWALAQSCKNLASKQGSFMQNLMKSLDCVEEEKHKDFILCLCKFNDFDTTQKQSKENLQKDKLSLHGTLILQLLLEFNKPIKIVNGLLSLDQNELKALFSNTMGSHIVDSYVKSLYVGEKSREKLIRKMKGTYQELASSKFGSRSFEAIWNAANLKNKLAIMEELVYKDGSWSSSQYGKIIANKINLALYKRNKEEWKNSLNTVKKAEKLFEDILK
ncbi:nucleolar protein 9 [Tribolium castaneum]|uniref:Nucleolar protein 9-like Protein n=1 Tax=Tribolium castaneum TaxID=7070 RepID=D6WS25_TRICA|nr:PREDICTED: nucleolar protein 9 [Tribolium castaneum]EFA07079.1 Nucleolar protein 9-like Protein [Tribolium castaneum]|eukprot:XP_008196017.1 PREDICTED: nucleolar protein 9 [Tribolium castaneum]